LEIDMPQYRVEALEKFIVRTVYVVEAHDAQAAEAKCKAGDVAYDQSSIEEGDEEWLETVSIERDD
jgi:hypothetical protein